MIFFPEETGLLIVASCQVTCYTFQLENGNSVNDYFTTQQNEEAGRNQFMIT
jgi:hypothetical protein